MQLSILDLLESSGAILRGHFKLTSGRHSDTYFEKFRILEKPAVLSYFCSVLAEKFKDDNIETVAGPTLGGVLIAYEIARHLNINSVYFERENEARILRRGAVIPKGARVLIADDILTTGKSLIEVYEALLLLKVEIVGAALLLNRSEKPLDLGFRIESLGKVEVNTYASDDCLLCKKGVSLQTHGSRGL